ncbi:hypothetical protein D4764_01G0007010 [Takifugu flavidus]|uniref:Ig-like domain-containing protein n=1 Tax=Takifugu flavidus TaxID=433684 RepID=A0A5C6PPT3_9TELE|nr:hypothetical protein D4764_01G0007010 [Takifugu flavidus]
MALRVFQAFFLNVTFCLAPQPDIEYEWFFYGNTQPGPQLRIFLDNKHDERVYSCRVSNRLSNETAEFTAKDCYSDESSPGVLAAVLPSVVLRLLLVVLVVVLVLVVAGVLIYRRYYKGRDNETAEDGESQLPLTFSPIKAPQPDIEYEWFFYGNTQPGPQLRIFLDNKHDERVYSCRVSNPLSNETAEFTAKDCYSVVLLLVVLVVVVV